MLAASIRQRKIGIALALLDRSHEKQIKLTLADVFIDRALRKMHKISVASVPICSQAQAQRFPCVRFTKARNGYWVEGLQLLH